MRKLFCCFLAVSLFVVSIPFSVFAREWNTSQPEKNSTSKGIIETLNPVYNDRGKLTGIDAIYTIPEDFKEDQLVIVPGIFDKVAELTNDTGSAMMPGSKVSFSITIKNLSSYDYFYQDQSFVLSTEDLSKAGLTPSQDAISFSGQQIYTIHEPYRTGNSAIVSLYGVSSSSKLKDEQLTDEVLGEQLKKAGYTGIEQLSQYYLDYYNQKNGTNVQTLEDFSDDIIKQIFNGNRFVIKETQKEIVELSYDWFYNKLFAFTFEGDTYQDKTSEQYSIGSYMRNPSMGNKQMNSHFLELTSNSEKSLNGMQMHVNGPYTVNTYMLYPFSAYMEFSFERKVETGTVISHYVDEKGNPLREDVITTGEVNTSYQTSAKEIDGYQLKKVEGEPTGQFVKGNIHVTYIYEKTATTGGNIEELPPHTGI